MNNSQIDNVKLELKPNSTTKDEVYSVRPSIAKPNVVCSASVHEFVLKSILSFTPKIKEVSMIEFEDYYEDCSIDYHKKEIEIQVCREGINWIKEGKLNFASRCYIDVENIVKCLEIKGEHIDAYGSVLTKNGLLLNNYDASFEEQNKNEKGFCDVLGFSTISKEGVVRFSQIVYSFLFKKLIVRDNVVFKLSFKPNLKNDFGGKRATCRNGSILSLRTNLKIYKKVDKKYWQSEKRKNDLSYPRLQLF